MKKVTNGNNYKRLKVQLVLGNPRIGCDGYGICKIGTKNTMVYNPCHSEKTIEGQLSIEKDFLSILFFKNKMSVGVYQKYFSKGVFVMESDFMLPIEIATAFAIPPSVLKHGNYRIYERKDVIFQVYISRLNPLNYPILAM